MRYSPSTGCFYPETIVYASEPDDLIKTTDAIFQQWLASAPGSTITVSGGALTINPPPIPTSAEIAATLRAYASLKRQTIADGGITVNVGTAAAPVNCHTDTSAAGRTNLVGLVTMAGLNSAFTTTWYQSTGAITLTAAEITALGVAVAEFIASTYAAEAAVLSAISAGTITTPAQVDAASWPANS